MFPIDSQRKKKQKLVSSGYGSKEDRSIRNVSVLERDGETVSRNVTGPGEADVLWNPQGIQIPTIRKLC